MILSVSGNAICRSCFRVFALSCYTRSTIVRWRPSLSAAIVTQLVTRLQARGRGRPSMRTIGAVLLAVKRCSLARVRMVAQDGRSAHGLLYLAAIRASVCRSFPIVDDARVRRTRQGLRSA